MPDYDSGQRGCIWATNIGCLMVIGLFVLLFALLLLF